MKLLLLGRRHSVNHWLEDAAGALAAAGHAVSVSHVRRPPIPLAAERALWPAMGQRLARRLGRERFDLVLVIGGFHIPGPILEPIAAAPGRPPIAGWVGDAFDQAAARPLAGLYDLIGYTDTGLLARAQGLGFARGLFLPHAADPSGAWRVAAARREEMVFIANATPLRREVVAALASPIALYGPGWAEEARRGFHQVQARRTPPGALRALYGAHRTALNVRNEINVLSGLNQRSFDPALAGAAILSDDQPDLSLCFQPGVEVAVWRDLGELNALYARSRRDPAWTSALAQAARARVLAEHTYEHRLARLIAALR